MKAKYIRAVEFESKEVAKYMYRGQLGRAPYYEELLDRYRSRLEFYEIAQAHSEGRLNLT